jgi:CheY-like chemotaxis protein
MTVIATKDPRVLEVVEEVVPAPRRTVVLVDGDFDEASRRLRHEVHSHQPKVVLLDARFGGRRWFAVDAVPGIVKVRSNPFVILLAASRALKVQREAARAGCYDVLNVKAKSFRADVSLAVAAATLDWEVAQAALSPPDVYELHQPWRVVRH